MSEPTRRWLPVVGVAGAVVAASLVPLPSADGAPLGPPGADKLLHAVGYAAVAYLVTRARGASGTGAPAAALGGVVAAAVLGGGVEVLQGVVPGRTPSLADAAANLAGALVGALARTAASQTRSNGRQ